RLIQNSITI
nr:Chain C, ARG-LEU-ILE-GLN-ASN-SER-ILE-THR-ILE [unidentified influenza virus]